MQLFLTQASLQPAPSPDASRSYEYDAFMSYSHAASGAFAPVLEERLRVFANPFWRRRMLRIFRDESTLQMTSHLWPTIKDALDKSKFFILLAAPQAAESAWVTQEVTYWLRERGPENFFIVLTDGAIRWSRTSGDFEWSVTTALPRDLSGKLLAEPKWEDARALKQGSDLHSHNPVLNRIVASLFSAITGRPLDDVIGEDVRQFRLRWLAFGSGIATIAAVIAIATAYYINLQKRARLDTAAILSSQNAAASSRSGNHGIAINTIIETLDKYPGILTSTHRDEVRAAVAGSIHQLREAALFPHDDELKQLVVEPDGRAFATESANVITVWSADQPTSLATATAPIAKNSLRSAGAGRLGWITTGGKPVVWNWQAATAPVELPVDGAAAKIEFEPLSGSAAVLTKDGSICALFFLGGPCTQVIKPGIKITDLALVAGSTGLTTVDTGGTLTVWNINTGQPVVTMAPKSLLAPELHEAVWRIVVDAKGRRALTWPYSTSDKGRPYRTAYLWDLSAQSVIDTTVQALDPNDWDSGDWITTASFSPDGTSLALVARQHASLWNATSGNLLAHLIGHTSYIAGASFSPSSRQAITWSYDQTARMWNVADGRPVATFGGHTDRVNRAAFTPDGCAVITASDDATARLWALSNHPAKIRLSQAPCAQAATGGQQSVLNAGALSIDGKLVATASSDHQARIWDLRTRELVKELPRQPQNVLAVAFTRDSRFLAVGEGSLAKSDTPSDVNVYDVKSGEKISSKHIGGRARNVSISSDGRYLLAAAGNGKGIVWAIDGDGRLDAEIVVPHGSSPVIAAEWSHFGTRIITTSTDRKACVWTFAPADAGFVHKDGCVTLTDQVFGAAWSPNDQRFVTVDGDSWLKVWEAKTALGQPENRAFKLLQQFKLESDLYTTKVTFAPSGNTAAESIIILQNDGKLKIYEIGSWRLPYEDTDPIRITNFSVSADGRLLLTTHGDGSAYVSPFLLQDQELIGMAQGLMVRCFTPELRQHYLGEAAGHAAPAWCASKWPDGGTGRNYRATAPPPP